MFNSKFSLLAALGCAVFRRGDPVIEIPPEALEDIRPARRFRHRVRKTCDTYRRRRSKYQPHQGARECARRLRQGLHHAENGR